MLENVLQNLFLFFTRNIYFQVKKYQRSIQKNETLRCGELTELNTGKQGVG